MTTKKEEAPVPPISTEDEMTWMVQEAQNAPEPGNLTRSQIINRGENSPQVANALTSAGYVYVWDVRNGDRSVVNRNMLPQQLRKLDPDTGKRVFDIRPPAGKTPWRGSLKCWLHEDDARRDHWNTLGLPLCKKSNIPSPFAVMQHVKSKHRRSWAVIENEQDEADRAAQRTFQETMAQIAKQQAGIVSIQAPGGPVEPPKNSKPARTPEEE